MLHLIIPGDGAAYGDTSATLMITNDYKKKQVFIFNLGCFMTLVCNNI